MFDISFTELIVIAVVALVVIGPERLPKVARTAGHLLGRLQRYVSDVKSDIQREMQLEELKKLQAEVAESARKVEEKLTTDLRDAEKQLQSGFDEAHAAGNEVAHAFSDAAEKVDEAGRDIAVAAEVPVAGEDKSPSPSNAPLLAEGSEANGSAGPAVVPPSPSTPADPVAKG